MVTKLEIELGKIDMKFSSADREKTQLDFFIRYCSPQALGFDEEGIAVCIHKFNRDRTGTNRLAVLGQTYPFTAEGLESARTQGLIAVKDLYELPANTPLIEVENLPKPWVEKNYDAIYRVNMMNVLGLISEK